MSQIVYGVLGASFLWPWNALITASSLAKQKLVNEPNLYASYASIVMTVSTLTSLISTTYLAYRSQNYGQRVKYGEVIIAIAFLVLGTIGELETGKTWLALVIFIVIVSSLGTALVQNGTLAISQRIPGPEHALAVMNGQGVAGVLPPLLPILASGAQVSALAPLSFLSVTFLSLIGYFVFSGKSNQQFVAMTEEASEHEDTTPPSWKKLWRLALQIRACTTAILLGFIISLSYPVFANTVESSSISGHYFSPITHLVWNSGDLAGRLLCSSSQFRVTNERTMITYSFARSALVILFIILARLGNPSDIVYLLAMFGYGLSNGHLVSSAIAHAPSCVPQNLQPATGGLLGLIIAVGLLLGSMFSFVVVAML